MKRGLLISIFCIIAIVAALGIPGCVGEKEVFELTFATAHPSEGGMHKVVIAAWADWLEEESDGRIQMTIFPAEQAAAAPELYDAAATGVVDIACYIMVFQPGRWPLTEVLHLPLIFEYPGSRALSLTAMALYNKYPEIQDEFSDVKVLGFHGNAPTHVHTVDKPVHTLEDWEGLLVDTTGKWGTGAIQALGASPEGVMPTERYDAMSKGVFNAAMSEWEGEFAWNLNELTHYSTECGLYVMAFVHVMNLDTWNSLPSDLQELFAGENAETLFTLLGYNFDKDDIAFREMLDAQYKADGYEGVYVLPDEERARWIEAIEPLWEQWVQEASAVVGEARARAILDDALAFAQEYGGYPDEACPECAGILHDWGASGY